MKNVINYSFLIIFIAISILPGCKKNNPVPKPVINTISPSSGVAGDSVTISGTGFDASVAGNTVKFNGAAATVTSASSSALVVTAPAGGSTGTVTVTTTGGTATGPVFTYLMAPAITSMTPASGKAAATISITGVNFDSATANNAVKFNGTAAVVTSATTTALVVTAPAGGSTGTVTVTTPGGTATGPVFTYLQAPVITGISPASAAAGASVTITGTNFDATAANNAVNFNGTIAAITSATVTQMVVTVPAGGTSGNVIVTTPGGASNAFSFTYVTATGPDIYVLGSDTRYGFGYWKNFIFTPVANWANPYAIVGSGNDIYVAGPATSQTPTYWKNNTAVQLSAQTGFTFSIVVSGTDVYCMGGIGTAYYTWKNGTPTVLNTSSVSVIGSGGSSLNNAMAVNNGDVYVAGAQYLGNSTVLKATYWKNGTPVDLTDGIHSGSAKASAVFISGSDVYVAGVEDVHDPGTGGLINEAPRVWKNGVSISLNTPANSLFNSISSILVKGADVYVGGKYNGAGAVWKNGTMKNTSSYALAENVSSIFLYNNTDIYVTGASSASGNNCYWKNGNFVEMDPGCNVVSSSCARTSANQVTAIYVK